MNDRDSSAGSTPQGDRRPTAPETAGQAPDFTRQMHRGTAAYELVFSPVLLALFGLFLDRQVFDTTPIITVVLAVVGFAGAAVKLIFTYRMDLERVMADAPYLPNVDRSERPSGAAS